MDQVVLERLIEGTDARFGDLALAEPDALPGLAIGVEQLAVPRGGITPVVPELRRQA